MAALAAGLVAVGAAEGVAYVVAGGLLGAATAAFWTAQVWQEHPSWTPRLGSRMSQRVLVPGLLPVVALLTTALIAISLSRVLLAVSKDGSVVVAMVAAIVIFGTCAIVAYRPRLGPGTLIGLIAVAAVFAGTAGVFGAAAGERTFHPEHAAHVGFKIVAQNIAFDKKEITVPAREDIRGDFANLDHGTYHDFAVYKPGPDPSTTGAPVFASRPIAEGEVVFDMRLAEPGRYVFVCDFHPNMRGDLVAE
jgi:plastocyanin